MAPGLSPWTRQCVTLLVFLTVGAQRHVSSASLIYEMVHWRSNITHGLATDQLTYAYRNMESKAKEIEFRTESSPNKVITLLQVCDYAYKCNDGLVTDVKKARSLYQQAISNKQVAAYGEQSRLYQDKVYIKFKINIPSGARINVTIHTQSVMRKSGGVYVHGIWTYLQYPTEKLLFEAHIQDFRGLSLVHVLDSKDQNGIDLGRFAKINSLLQKGKAQIRFSANTKDNQFENAAVELNFEYDVKIKRLQGDFMATKDGYFTHLIQPDLLAQKASKDIVFLLEVSDNMKGSKVEQVERAMKFILYHSDPIDRFLLILYGSFICKGKNFFNLSSGGLGYAKYFVSQIRPSGQTNINDALTTALDQFKRRKATDRAGVIFLLNSHRASIVETNPLTILSNVARQNDQQRISIHSIGVGTQCDTYFLSHLSEQNSGVFRFVHETRHTAVDILRAFKEISVGAVQDMNVSYLENAVYPKSLTQTLIPTALNGTEVVICGLLRENLRPLRYTIQSGRKKSLIVSNVVKLSSAQKDPTWYFLDDAGIAERIWALTKISQLLLERDKLTQDSKNAKLVSDEILTLSLKYQVVTPLTAIFIAVLDHPETFVWQSNLNPDNRNVRNNPKRYRPKLYPTCRHNIIRRPQHHSQKKSKTRKLKVKRLMSLTIDPGKSRKNEHLKRVCLIPKKLKAGNFTLLSKKGKFKVVLFMCIKHYCPKGHSSSSLRFYLHKAVEEGYVEFKGYEHWYWDTGRRLAVYPLSKKLITIHGRWFAAKIMRNFRRSKEMRYRIHLILKKDRKAFENYEGVLGRLASSSSSELQTLLPKRILRGCNKMRSDYQLIWKGDTRLSNTTQKEDKHKKGDQQETGKKKSDRETLEDTIHSYIFKRKQKKDN